MKADEIIEFIDREVMKLGDVEGLGVLEEITDNLQSQITAKYIQKLQRGKKIKKWLKKNQSKKN